MPEAYTPGTRFIVPFELVRPVEKGDIYLGKTMNNRWRNLWWAKPVAYEHESLVICTDENSLGDFQRAVDAWTEFEKYNQTPQSPCLK